MTDLDALLPRIERLLDRLDAPAAAAPDWKSVRAARWSAQAGELKPIRHPQRVALRDLLADADYRFIVFIDDLTFAEHEAGYASLKAALDGSLAGPSDNVLIYATSTSPR